MQSAVGNQHSLLGVVNRPLTAFGKWDNTLKIVEAPLVIAGLHGGPV